MRVAYAGVMESPINGTPNGFTKAMASVFDEYVEIPMSNVNAGFQGLKQVDLVFLQPQDSGISAETLMHLKSIGAFIVNWTGDCRSIIPPCYFEYAKYVDLTAFSNMNDVNTFRSLGYKTDWLQIGYDPAIYYPDETVKDIDVVFMGNNFSHFPLSGYRREMVAELKRVYGDRFKAFGSGQPDGSFMGDQKGEADIYRRAKMGINLSHFNYERYTSDRMFRLLGSGLLVLSHEYKGIYEDFNPHDFGIWQDFEQLKSLIDHYSVDDEARIKIANNGHQKALDNYTFHHMAANIKQLYLNK